MDNLNYSYDSNNPNQLKKVTDGTGTDYTSYGFRNLSGSTSDYIYANDGSGNLTADPYKGLTLTYNILNKTDQVTITSATNRYIRYTYNGSGQIIRKQLYDNAILQTTTDYIDGFVFENNALSYFPIPEGRILNANGTLTPEFVITDQQGNARVSFKDDGSGKPAIVQENSYYAFGMVLANSPVTTPTQPNKNLYNGGSEWQNDFSNLPDYYQTFFRNYDAALGRFISLDPQIESAESMTGYHYAGNDPIMYNDPLGDRPLPVEPAPWDPSGGGGWSGGFRELEAFQKQAEQSEKDFAEWVQYGEAAELKQREEMEAYVAKYGETYIPNPNYNVELAHYGNKTYYDADRFIKVFIANQGGDPPTYRLRHVIKDGIEQDNTPFLILFPVLKGVKTVWNLLRFVKEDPQAELQSIRELKNFKYDPRLENQTDLYHNFPRSFDRIIIENAPWAQRIKDGANWFESPGWVNDKPGNFQIGINDQGVIFHRNFVPLP